MRSISTTNVDSRLQVRVLYCAIDQGVPWEHDNLAAPYWRLYWNDRSGAEVLLYGQRTALTPRRFVLIPPETPFGARKRGCLAHFYIHFVVQRALERVAPQVFALPVSAAARLWVDEAIGLLRCGALGARLGDLCQVLCRQALLAVPEQDLAVGSRDARVLAALEYLEGHLADGVTNRDLAAAAGMQVNAFCRLFRREVQQSPQQFCRQRRVAEACRLLQFTDQGMEAIAAATGFCDRYHLSRVFRALRGMGPAAYRKRIH